MLMVLWYTLTIYLAPLKLEQSDDNEHDDGGWEDDFPGHQTALMPLRRQLSASHRQPFLS
jgi:hypothetical protein